MKKKFIEMGAIFGKRNKQIITVRNVHCFHYFVLNISANDSGSILENLISEKSSKLVIFGTSYYSNCLKTFRSVRDSIFDHSKSCNLQVYFVYFRSPKDFLMLSKLTLPSFFLWIFVLFFAFEFVACPMICVTHCSKQIPRPTTKKTGLHRLM